MKFRSLETIRSYKLLEREKNGLIQKESRITMVLDLREKLKDTEIILSKFWGDRISKGSLYPAAPCKKVDINKERGKYEVQDMRVKGEPKMTVTQQSN